MYPTAIQGPSKKEWVDRLPRLALYVLCFSIPFEMWDPLNTNGDFSVARLTAFIYLFSTIPSLWRFVRLEGVVKFLLPVWLFFGLLLFVNLYNRSNAYSEFFDRSFFLGLILFWVLLNHERADRLVLEKGLLVYGLSCVVLALLYTQGFGLEYVEGRAKLFGENENKVGIHMATGMLVLMTAVFQDGLKLGKARLLLLLPVPFMISLMAETGSRVAFISFALASLAGMLLWKTKRVWTKVAICVVGVAASILIWQFAMESEMIKARMLSTIEQADLSGRDQIWSKLLPLLGDHIVFGVGQTGYAAFSAPAFASLYGFARSPHNVFLEVLCYTGVVGLILYLTFLFFVIRNAYQNYSHHQRLLPLLILFPIFGLLLSGQILGQKYGWLIFAYIGGSSLFGLKRPERESLLSLLANPSREVKLPS
jgi:O-antigen ligase